VDQSKYPDEEEREYEWSTHQFESAGSENGEMGSPERD
jgi:hypothetical protein